MEARHARWTAGRLLSVLCWCCVVTLYAGVILRLFWHDGMMLLVWFNSFTPYVYLPAYAALGVGLLQRKWLLSLCCLPVIGCHLLWLMPDYLPLEAPATVEPGESRQQKVRVFYQNVWMWSKGVDETLREIEENQPDIVILVEYTRQWHRQTAGSPTLRAFPYGTTSEDRYTGQTVLFSKLPLKTYQIRWPARRPIVDALIDVDGQAFRLLAVHSPRPLHRHRHHHEAFWQRISTFLEEDDKPTIIVGDFNLTQHSRWYQRLTSGPLRDAFRACGLGHLTTWPNGKSWLPEIRIDHVLLSPELQCLGVRTGEGRTSDHRPIIVDLQLGPNRSPP